MTAVQQHDLEHWRKHGYVIIEKFLSDAELEAALHDIHVYMPSWEDYLAHRHLYEPLVAPGLVSAPFPFEGDGLNHVVFHPYLLDFAQTVLETDDVALTQAGLMGKYAGKHDYEQTLHVDYGNNTLVYPKNDPSSFIFPVIVYYTDVTVDSGPTYVVSQEVTGDDVGEPRHRSRDDYPDLYAYETPVTVPAGSALIYSMRTFHRGSAMRATQGVRYTHHLTYQPAGPRWIGKNTWLMRGGSPEMDHFVATATPKQREMVGFPPVGDPYWDAETLAGVAKRYPAMDMTPYREGAAARGVE